MLSSERQLVAIMFIDIVGYTSLMQRDESAAISTIRKFKEIIESTVSKYNGKVIQYFGDGSVITFQNTTNAVRCARELQILSGEQENSISTRIGLHLGEVLFQNSNVFGDSVNIASRIETICTPGGIFMSSTIRNQIKNKSEFDLRFIGKYHFKNVDDPIKVYYLASEGLPIPDPNQVEGKLDNLEGSGRRKKLVAIVSTEIHDLDSIVDTDFNNGMELLEKTRVVQKKYVDSYGGTIISSKRQSSILSFPTASDALLCSKEIQRELAKEVDLSLKLGMHIGEAIIENGDLYGEGVEIANKLRNAAEPGGIYMTDSVLKAIHRSNKDHTIYLGQIMANSGKNRFSVHAVRANYLSQTGNVYDNNIKGSFWAAVQRRNLPRVITSYFLVSLILYGIAITLPALNPYRTWIIGALGLGLIIGIVLAWFYEKGPQGFVLINSIKSWENPYSEKRKKPLTSNVALVTLVVIAVGIGMFHFLGNKTRKPLLGAKSIAVLPFANLSDDPNQSYFVDGIQEDILIHLAKISELQVKSRSATLQYKDSKNLRLKQVGRDLGVAHVLEGSVRKAGNQLRITAKLIDVESENHIWSEAYDRSLTDIFSIQSEVAASIANRLNVKLSNPEKNEINKVPTLEVSAYDLELRAREIWRSVVSEQDLDHIIQLMREAIQIDPKYAPAYALLGDALRYKGNHLSDRNLYVDSALTYLNKALELNPNSFRALRARSIILKYPWVGKREEGLRDQEKAIKLIPNDAEELWNLGWTLLKSDNRYFRGSQYIIQSIKTEWGSKDPSFFVKLAQVYEYIEDYETAENYCEQALTLEPNHTGAIQKLYWLNMLKKDYEGALPFALKVQREFPNNWRYTDRIIWVHLFLKQWPEAEKLLWRLAEQESERYQSIDSLSAYIPWRHRMAYVKSNMGYHDEGIELAMEDLGLLEMNLSKYPGKRDRIERYCIASTNAFLGNPEIAIEMLEEAYSVGSDLGYDNYLKDPHFDPYRELPEFKSYEMKVKERDFGRKRQNKNEALRQAVEEFENSVNENNLAYLQPSVLGDS